MARDRVRRYLRSSGDFGNEDTRRKCDQINSFNQRISRAPFPSPTTITFTRYHRYEEIDEYLNGLTRKYQKIVKIQNVGVSSEKRPLKVVHIREDWSKPDKPTILIEAGVHAREWICPAVALFVIHSLVERFDEHRSSLLSDFNWIIFPLVNPDGYEYSHSHDPKWRKTRSSFYRFSYGADINRNFGFHWGGCFSSSQPTSEFFRGRDPFSEPETRALRDVMISVKGTGIFYISLHSHGPSILYPYGFERRCTGNHNNLKEVVDAGVSAIKVKTGEVYEHDVASIYHHVIPGNSLDYAYAIAKFPIALTMVLPGKGMKFHPKSEKIREIVEETWVGITAMVEKVRENFVRAPKLFRPKKLVNC